MSNTASRRIITIILVIGLISTQFVFAASESTVEEQRNSVETYESEVINLGGEAELESDSSYDEKSEIESDFENDIENNDFSTDFERVLNENEIQNENILDETGLSRNNIDNDLESQNPPLRDYNSNYFSNVTDAANYLDEKIDDYLNNTGSPIIELYIEYDGDTDIKYTISYYSHLYNALCGYGNNLKRSINFQYAVLNDNVYYNKYEYNLESTLTHAQIIDICSIANGIATGTSQYQLFGEKISYIKSEIRSKISYHSDCSLLTSNPSQYEKCNTAYALHNGYGICSGFTGAFCLVCYEAGLNAIPIMGYVKQPGGTSDLHAWNLIKNGNAWKQIDCTFNAPLALFGTDMNNTRGAYSCFTALFKLNHIIDTVYSGWIETNAGWSYIDSYGYSKVESWQQDSVDMCYLGADGSMVTSEWLQDYIGWRYIDGSGHVARSRWVQTDSYWYYQKSNGYRAQSEWIQDSVDWCYLGSDGKMVTSDWAQDSIGWCYLDSTGHITRSQWLLKNNEWYYLKADGHMATNEWAQDSVGWCYMDSNGHITRSQWLQKNGYWYYLKADGHMATNEWIEDSIDWCYMGSDGRMVTSDWAQDSVGWCYMNSSGHITRSAWIQKNGYWYYLKANGYMAVNEWAIDSNGYCWMDSNGHWVTGTKWIGSPRTIGSSYIISGHRVNSATINIDGYDCTFNGAGQLTTFVYNPGVNPGTQ